MNASSSSLVMLPTPRRRPGGRGVSAGVRRRSFTVVRHIERSTGNRGNLGSDSHICAHERPSARQARRRRLHTALSPGSGGPVESGLVLATFRSPECRGGDRGLPGRPRRGRTARHRHTQPSVGRDGAERVCGATALESGNSRPGFALAADRRTVANLGAGVGRVRAAGCPPAAGRRPRE